MSIKKLYALTDSEASELRQMVDQAQNQSLTDQDGVTYEDLTHLMVPLNTPLDRHDAVERMCKAFYEAGADKLDDTIRPQWDNLVRVSPDIAQGYRERVSAALDALLGGEQE